MADKDILPKSLNALALLNTAIKNARLYPPASAAVSTAIEKLHLALADLLTADDQIVFAESERALLIDGQSLSQKDQERPHAASLLSILLGFGLKSMTFCRGMERDELERLIVLLSRGAESVLGEGGLNRQLTDQRIEHVLLDQKVYVAVDKDHQILASLDVADDQIMKLFVMTHPDMAPESPEFREMAANPQALAKAFKTGLTKIMAQRDTMTSAQLSESLSNMLLLLDKVASGLDHKNRTLLSERVGQALLAADPVMAEQMTAQHMESLLGGLLLQYLMAELTKEKLGVAGSGGNDETVESAADGTKSKLLQVAEKFGLRLQDTRTLLDDDLMSVLPKIIEQLIAQKEQEAMENLLERLAANLMNEKAEIRLSAVRSLVDIIEHLPGERKNEVIQKLSWALIAWVRQESVFSPEYQKLWASIASTTQDLLSQRRISEAVKYVAGFRAVADDAGKPAAILGIVRDAISELASGVYINILLHEIDSPEKQIREDTGKLFVALGNEAIEDLLDELKTKTDSDERVRIIHLITSAKEKALPLIIARITDHALWFYLRNIAYLLGQIGNEESARSLIPLLSHNNDKLRQEALKSVYRTGGSRKGLILLEALPLADDEFKSSIVDALGQAKATEAVPALIELMKNRPLIATTARTTLEERICMALGTIGTPDAIAMLSEIAQAKTFLKLRTYPEKVTSAAKRSMAALKRKAAQTDPSAT